MHRTVFMTSSVLIDRKTISLEITDEESYEKNLIMYVNIGEPRQIAGKECADGSCSMRKSTES